MSSTLEPIQSELETLCRIEGWTLEEFQGLVDFDRAYKRRPPKGSSPFKLPRQFRFHNLHEEIGLALGLARTEKDPPTTKGEVYHHWPSTEPNPSDDVTAFFYLHFVKGGWGLLDYIQASTIGSGHDEVEKWMIRTNQSDERLNRLRLYGVPWHYSDRFFLLGIAALRLTKLMGLDELRINPFRGHTETRTRFYQYASKHVRMEGMRLRYNYEVCSLG